MFICLKDAVKNTEKERRRSMRWTMQILSSEKGRSVRFLDLPVPERVQY